MRGMRRVSLICILTVAFLAMGCAALAQVPPPPPPPAPAVPPPPPPSAAPPPAPPVPGAPASVITGPAAVFRNPVEYAVLARRAVDTARAAVPHLAAGPAWYFPGPAGERDWKLAMMQDGRVAAVIRIDPATGALLPRGLPPTPPGGAALAPGAREAASRACAGVRVLPAAELRAPERCWSVPLAVGGMIVGELRVTLEGDQLVPDYGAEGEMRTATPGP